MRFSAWAGATIAATTSDSRICRRMLGLPGRGAPVPRFIRIIPPGAGRRSAERHGLGALAQERHERGEVVGQRTVVEAHLHRRLALALEDEVVLLPVRAAGPGPLHRLQLSGR